MQVFVARVLFLIYTSLFFQMTDEKRKKFLNIVAEKEVRIY